MPNAVEAVIEERNFIVGFDALLGIVPHQPDAVAVALLPPKLICEFKEQRAGGSAVISSHEACVAQRIIRVVMAGDNDDPVFRSGKLGDDVMDGKLSFGRVGGEGVVLDLVAFEMGEQIVFDLLVICAADGTGAERYDVFHVLEGAGGINCRPRTSVGWERKPGESRVS